MLHGVEVTVHPSPEAPHQKERIDHLCNELRLDAISRGTALPVVATVSVNALEAAAYRAKYLAWMHAHVGVVWRQKEMRALIVLASIAFGDPKPPSVRSVYRWRSASKVFGGHLTFRPTVLLSQGVSHDRT